MEAPTPASDDLWMPVSDDEQPVNDKIPMPAQVQRSMLWLMLGVSLALGIVLGHFLLPYAHRGGEFQSLTANLPSSGTDGSSIVVDVHGDVKRPGTYTLPRNARVKDAVTSAGGYIHPQDVTAVNAAAPLDDGAEVVIPTVNETVGGRDAPMQGDVTAPSAANAKPTVTASTGRSLIDLNTASVQTLETLPSIGPTRAQDIVNYRQIHGDFRDVSDLKNVHGIGPTLFARISPYVNVNRH